MLMIVCQTSDICRANLSEKYSHGGKDGLCCQFIRHLAKQSSETQCDKLASTTLEIQVQTSTLYVTSNPVRTGTCEVCWSRNATGK